MGMEKQWYTLLKGPHINIINIIDRPSRDVSELISGEEKEGKARLEEAIIKYTPKVVCFVGKVTYEKFSGRKNFDFGWNGSLFGSKVYVMHFPLRGKASVRVKELKIVLNNA